MRDKNSINQVAKRVLKPSTLSVSYFILKVIFCAFLKWEWLSGLPLILLARSAYSSCYCQDLWELDTFPLPSLVRLLFMPRQARTKHLIVLVFLSPRRIHQSAILSAIETKRSLITVPKRARFVRKLSQLWHRVTLQQNDWCHVWHRF